MTFYSFVLTAAILVKNAIVIIPTYKERENIRAIIDTVFGASERFSHSYRR